LSTRCEVYLAARRYPDAIADCTSAIGLDDRNGTPHFFRGRAEIEQKDWDAAIDDFSDVIARDPGEAGAYYWRATAEAGSDKYAAGLADVDRFLHAHGDDADGLLLRARIEMGLGNANQAQTSAADALRHYRIDNDAAGAARAQALLDDLKASSAERSH
jgi:tetratricopeptide (TPR) repeat protein